MPKGKNFPSKIVRVMDRLNIGGPAIHAVLLTQKSSEGGLRDWETVLVTGKEGIDEGSMLPLAESRGVQPVFIPSLGRELHAIKDITTLWRLCCLIAKERPLIV